MVDWGSWSLLLLHEELVDASGSLVGADGFTEDLAIALPLIHWRTRHQHWRLIQFTKRNKFFTNFTVWSDTHVVSWCK